MSDQEKNELINHCEMVRDGKTFFDTIAAYNKRHQKINEIALAWLTVESGWIKCSERIPDDDEFVLVWPLPDFGVELHVGQYCKWQLKGAGWYAQVDEQNYGIEWHPINVTHWQPRPAPPEE